MNKAELESKHIAELHALAAEAGVERYRMLSRAELIEKLAGGEAAAKREKRGRAREAAPRARAAASANREPRAPAPAARAAARGSASREPQGRASRGSGPTRARAPRPRRGDARRRAAEPADAATPPPPLRSQAQGRQRPRPAAAAARPPGARLRREPRRLHGAAARDRRGALGGLEGPRPDRPAGRPQPRGARRLEARGAQAEIVAAGQARHAERRPRPGRAPRRGRRRRDPPDRLARPLEDADAAKEIFDGGLSLRLKAPSPWWLLRAPA